MKYFGIIDKNVVAIFQLQWKIGNISEMFLQYSVLRGFYNECFFGHHETKNESKSRAIVAY